MKRSAIAPSKPRGIFARFFVALVLAAVPAHAQEAFPVTNAGARDYQSVADVLSSLQRAAEARDPNGLAFFGASVPADASQLRLSVRNTHIAVSPTGALVRQTYNVQILRQPPVTLSSGTQELWLTREAGGGFALSTRRFVAPPDAAAAMATAAASEIQGNDPAPALLDLVAARVGGRWIALRRQRWDGALEQDPGAGNPDNALPVRDYLARRMAAIPRGKAVTVHFIFQKEDDAWIGIGSAQMPSRRISPSADGAAAAWRDRALSADYVTPSVHRDLAYALVQIGLFNEAADEFQKAELLQPGTVPPERLKQAQADRVRDQEALIAAQIERERAVGLGPEHPRYLIDALTREQRNQPSVLGSLRLALEYSRLADEQRAQAWQTSAETMMNSPNNGIRPRDRDWVTLLEDHLNERKRTAAMKPTQILRSPLFTVRTSPDDDGSLPVLAALEEAQHTVYADFGIPMDNTEVLLWRNQSDFAKYTTQFSAQGGSEFVAALTLTKLVYTAEGPMVLGEEVNTFADARETSALFGTIAHEYGHVAVRQLSKGRTVPVWFNEGIATSVEGGYEGYINRVRRATSAGTLLSMNEMLRWNVDGERAFLAYSQANSMVDYIVSKWGKGAVLEILRQIGRDVPADNAFRNVLGVSQGELWNRWAQEWLR